MSASFIRPAIMLSALAAILFVSTHQKIYSRSWHEPLAVTIYPINGDNAIETHNYITNLTQANFANINAWFEREAKRFDMGLSTPFDVKLGKAVQDIPPQFPNKASPLSTIWWSLKLRYWVYSNTPDNQSNLRRVRVFVVYQQGHDSTPLAHSIGLQKGLIGLVNAYGLDSQTEQNNIVIAHEILHTVGASDKYGFNGHPQYPQGYANPDRQPMFPQRYAEIMAGRIPTSQYQSYMPKSLRSTRMNALTAHEIAWLRGDDFN